MSAANYVYFRKRKPYMLSTLRWRRNNSTVTRSTFVTSGDWFRYPCIWRPLCRPRLTDEDVIIKHVHITNLVWFRSARASWCSSPLYLAKYHPTLAFLLNVKLGIRWIYSYINYALPLDEKVDTWLCTTVCKGIHACMCTQAMHTHKYHIWTHHTHVHADIHTCVLWKNNWKPSEIRYWHFQVANYNLWQLKEKYEWIGIMEMFHCSSLTCLKIMLYHIVLELQNQPFIGI